ncbi:MAG: metallophosphoesterase family protein [Clostridia bacterium]|nr:metallophosphoesterase family protein [Clostridia bacterium]
MKKYLSVCLALVLLCCTLSVGTYAADAQTELCFKQDGTFRIMQINDFQDTEKTNWKSLDFLDIVLDRYQPDLVVFVGDQLKNSYPKPTVDKLVRSLTHQLKPLQDRGIPFLYTFGNHDHDLDYMLTSEEQAKVYDSFSMSRATHNGPDVGTYNRVIYGSDGVTPRLNIYMMDTHNWNDEALMSGVNEAQVQWYKQTGNALKEACSGKAVPSLVFQHIPVKEVYKLLKEVPAGTEGCVETPFSDKHYVLDESKMIGDYNIMHEGVYSENINKTTGQYEAWLEQGDIIGAYFAHDHANTFVGKTEDGVVLGYNGGFGFASYGDGAERYLRIYDFKESDVAGYKRTTLHYSQEVHFFDLVRLFFPRVRDVLRDVFRLDPLPSVK